MSSQETESEDPEDREEEDRDDQPEVSASGKNYITPEGADSMKAELNNLLKVERPKLVETIAWAAGNGDRSENADYIYGKRRLREIDRRIRFLSKRLEKAEIVRWEESERAAEGRIRFGAWVRLQDDRGRQREIRIVGIDESQPSMGWISWISPMARALMGQREGDWVSVVTPGGVEDQEILEVSYRPL